MEKEKQKKHIPDIRPEEFHWVVYGIGCGILLILTVCTLLIIRIFDGMWLSWQLPAIMAIVYFVLVSVTALALSIKTIRQELLKQNQSKEK